MLSPPEARDLLRCVGCGKGLKDTLSLAGHRTGCSDACAGRQETRGRGSRGSRMQEASRRVAVFS